MKIEAILQQITNWSLMLAALLIPSFFLPITADWLEWNKHYLLGILVVVALLCWLGQGMIAKKITVVRSPLELPLVIWWGVLLVASIISKDRIVSFFGQFENVSGGFLSFTFLILFVLLCVSSIRKEQVNRFLLFFGIGGMVSVAYFWLARLGLLDLLSKKLPQWNPSAGLNSHFGIMAVLFMVFALGMLLAPRLGKARVIFWSVLAALSLLTTVAIGFKVLWVALAVGCFLTLLFALPRMKDIRQPIISLVMALFVLSVVFVIIPTPQFLTIKTPTEITLAHSRSWQLTFDTLKEGVVRMFLGGGPDTFLYSFTEHRPASYNETLVWNTRFSRPTASSQHLLAGSGILGALAFALILLIGAGMIWYGWQKSGSGLLTKIRRKTAMAIEGEFVASGENVTVFYAVAATWLTAAVMMFFVVYGGALWFVFFSLLALLPMVGNWAGIMPERAVSLSLRATPQYALASSFVYIVVLAAVIVGGIFLGRFYTGDILAVQAARAALRQDFERAEQGMANVVRLNPYRVNYELARAEMYLRHASKESRRTPPDVQKVGQLVGNAVNISRRATQLAPRSVATWEQLIRMYANARPFSKEANGWVVNSVNEAIKLEPNNARLYLLRSTAYRADKKFDEAETDIRQAIELKRNYAAAYYSLSVILEEKKDVDGAVEAGRQAVRYAPRTLDAQFNLGRLLYNRNQGEDWKEAEQVFRRILSQNRDYANAVFSLAVLLERQGKVSEARTLYERALELSPNNQAIKDRLSRLGRNIPEEVEPEPETLPEEEQETR